MRPGGEGCWRQWQRSWGLRRPWGGGTERPRAAPTLRIPPARTATAPAIIALRGPLCSCVPDRPAVPEVLSATVGRGTQTCRGATLHQTRAHLALPECGSQQGQLLYRRAVPTRRPWCCSREKVPVLRFDTGGSRAGAPQAVRSGKPQGNAPHWHRKHKKVEQWGACSEAQNQQSLEFRTIKYGFVQKRVQS